MSTQPSLRIDSDFDGYFERLVDGWIARKLSSGEPFKHGQIIVTAGPYRPSAVTYESWSGTLHLDFYSALRTGFGSLSERDVEELVALL